MNLTDYNAAAIDAVTNVMRPRSYPAAADLIADLTDRQGWCSTPDHMIAARALRADMADGGYVTRDGVERVHGNLTDAAQELVSTAQFYHELRDAMAGNDAAKLAFAKWFCTIYSAEVAAYVRRLVNDEIEP